MNGHTIFGLGGANVVHQAAGVMVNQHSNVTVLGGTVRDFFHGVWVLNGSNDTVKNMQAIDNTGGNGIVLQNVRDSTVKGNTVVGSGHFSGISVFNDRFGRYSTLSANDSIIGNTVKQSNAGPFTEGISLEAGSGHNVTGNTVSGSAADGISLTPQVSNARIVGNVVSTSGFNGINLQADPTSGMSSDNNTILGNRFSNNTMHGIRVASHGNRITGNIALRNGLEDVYDITVSPPCDTNNWIGNVFATANQSCIH